MDATAHLAGAFVVFAFLAHIGTTLVALRRLRVPQPEPVRLPVADGGSPVTIIRPVCGLDAYEELTDGGISARVVSLPSWYLFDLQPDDYREAVLPPSVEARVAVEQASTLGWDRYVGSRGRIVGMHTFGASAPLKAVQRKFGFTPDRVADAARDLLR